MKTSVFTSMRNINHLYLSLIFLVLSTGTIEAQTTTKPRTIVTTDGEVDDMDSFIRMLLYANDLDLIGLVYSSSEFHYSGDGKGTTFTSNMPWAKNYGTRTDLRWLGTSWIQEYLDKYSQYYPNLLLHDKNYPKPEYLKSLVKVGNIEFEGEMTKVTEGSEFIKSILLDNNAVPVHVQMWGGTNTVARALKSIEEQYKGTAQWEAIYKKVCAKTVLYIILDQDETYKNYVSGAWPDVTVIYNQSQFWCLAYPWNKVVPEPYRPYLGGKWFAENIKFNHGDLLAGYFLWGDGQKLVADPDHTHGDTVEVRTKGMQQYDFISEGDSPSYLYLLDVGLRSFEKPSNGGWGGRFVQSKTQPHFWHDGDEAKDYNTFDKKEDALFPQTRWVEALQNDFAARADWCIKPYQGANHPPSVKVKQSLDMNVKAGQSVQLNGTAKDPDGNSVSYKWWQYQEAGSYNGNVRINTADKADASFRVPGDAKAGDTIHIILEVTDNGVPALTRYQRVIAKVH
ncbi:nucleoside hydrolase-like domain-containing protein [Chryseolinea sp. T2]|uniref:DUF1593 domain-containing protein n=1 Tax=Chryseolinea sp. T2 TaxID=3129255 RepID=UPI0030785874